MAAVALIMGSCTGMNQATNNGTGTLGSVIGNVIQGGAQSGVIDGLLSGILNATTKLDDKALVGTWTYKGVDCVFESEQMLSQVGGMMAAGALEKQIDSQLTRVGIKPGSCQFTFKADHTYVATVAGKSLSGTWALDAANKQLKMTYLMGLGTLTPKVGYTGGTLSLLFESSKLLTLVQGVGVLTNNSAAQTLTGMLKNYKGLYLGLQMSK